MLFKNVFSPVNSLVYSSGQVSEYKNDLDSLYITSISLKSLIPVNSLGNIYI